MRLQITAFIKPALLLAALTMHLNAQAAFETFCDTTNPCTVTGTATIGVNSTVTVRWAGTIMNSTASPDTVRSQGGTFLVASRVDQGVIALGSTFTMLSTTVIIPPNAPDPVVSFNETLTVPASVSLQAANLGYTAIGYQRQFIDNDGPDNDANGIVVINLTPAPPSQPAPGTPPTQPPPPSDQPTVTGSALQITRIAQRFDNDQIARVVAQGEKLTALAYINYNNTGLLDAVWEIATPASTRGTPVFRPLQTLRQYLGAGRQAVLQSPPLPSTNLGLYLVRLRVIQPELGFEQTFIRYVVSKQAEQAVLQLKPIALANPPQGAALAKSTMFRWQSVAGAKAYQLELYDQPFTIEAPVARDTEQADTPPPDIKDKAPTSGIVVPGNRNSLALSELARQRLYPGRSYHWRVIAISEDGKILGTSELREIRVP